MNFILNDWFYHAKVDIKKQTKRNAEELLENVMARGISVSAIKKEHQEKRVINLLNGTLILTKRGKFTFKGRHDKRDGATNILNFNYDPKATAPMWQRFLNRVLPNKKEQEALMQYIGFCLMPSHDYEGFLFMYGKSGANGKSVIMDVISNFFGNDNISSLDLQQFQGHELEAIANKFVNIGSEIDPKGLDKGQLSTLKKIVSPKDKVPINPKNRTPYQLEAFEKPKVIFSGNGKPKQGMDDAVFRRMILLSFDSEIKDDEKIRGLSDRLTNELSGILNMALEELQSLVKNGKFTKSDKMLTEIESYKDDVNPIRKFVTDNLRLDTRTMIPKKFLYSAYKEWADEKGHKPLAENNFWKKIKEELPTIETGGKQRSIDVEFIDTAIPRFIEGVYFLPNDIASFNYNKNEVRTNAINYDIETKQLIIDNQKGSNNG